MTSTQTNAYELTQMHLDRCHRIIDENTGHAFYQVESATEVGKEYEVRYSRKHGLTCTCPAGNPPTDEKGYLLYAPRMCWHIRAAVAHADQHRLEQAQQAEREAHVARLVALGLTEDEAHEALSHQLIVDGKPANDETLVRVFGPQVRRPSEDEMNAQAYAYQSCGFSLLK